MNSGTKLPNLCHFLRGIGLDKAWEGMETRVVLENQSAGGFVMWPFRPSFKRKYARIQGGWSSTQVRELLGEPTSAEDTAVPLGSNWGLQAKLTFKIRGGEPVREWVYEKNGLFHYVWFARVFHHESDPWRVTLKKQTTHKL